MSETPVEPWPAGSRVRFTAAALAVTSWSERHSQCVFTVESPTGSGQDVLLDNGEVWWSGWLELAGDETVVEPNPAASQAVEP